MAAPSGLRFQWRTHGHAIGLSETEIPPSQCLQAAKSHRSIWIRGEALEELGAAQYSEDWATGLEEAAEKLREMLGTHRRLRELEADVAALRRDLVHLRDSRPIVIPVTTLAPEPVAVLRDIPVVVRPTEDGYLATLFDANIGMTGDTQEEAVENLKALLVDVFEQLEREESHLGPGPQRQLATLRTFLTRQD